jgi:polyhydroxyalkanoate synthesis regulator phasin
MDQLEPQDGIRAKLRRAWDAALCAADAMSISPMEDLSNRIDRLEREITEMREKSKGASRARVT